MSYPELNLRELHIPLKCLTASDFEKPIKEIISEENAWLSRMRMFSTTSCSSINLSTRRLRKRKRIAYFSSSTDTGVCCSSDEDFELEALKKPTQRKKRVRHTRIESSSKGVNSIHKMKMRKRKRITYITDSSTENDLFSSKGDDSSYEETIKQPSKKVNQSEQNHYDCRSKRTRVPNRYLNSSSFVTSWSSGNSICSAPNSNSSIQGKTVSKTKQSNCSKGKDITFSIDAIIGHGGFGKVWRAKCVNNGTIVAVKKMEKPPADNYDPEAVRDIMNEGWILYQNAVRRNPFTLKLVASYIDGNHLYIVTEYAPGGSLFSLVNKMAFTEQLAKYYTAQIALGIEYLHDDLGVVHRDLKPENILIDANGKAQIGDFGLATLSQTCTREAGTYSYMSPERLSGGCSTFAGDWWSLGIIHYFMLAGTSPFDYKMNFREESAELRAIKYFPPCIYHPDITDFLSEDGEKFIYRILDKNPLTRLGANGSREVLAMPYFNNIDLNLLRKNRLDPPIPNIAMTIAEVENSNVKYYKRVQTTKFSKCSLKSSDGRFSNFFYCSPSLL